MTSKTTFKAMWDSKFYKPGSETQHEIDEGHLAPSVQDFKNVVWLTNAGNRAVVGVAEDVTRGRFASKKAGDAKLVSFFEEFYVHLVDQIIQMRMTGNGYAIACHEGETISDLAKPIDHAPGNPLEWIIPETEHMFDGTNLKSAPQLHPLDWADQWQWWNHPVHRSRIEVLQFYPREDQVLGHAGIEQSMVALWGIYNLEKGALTRIAAWALLKLVFKIDPSTFTPALKAKYDKIAEAIGQSNWNILGGQDSIFQLGDTAGHGQELLDILYTVASTGLRIPVVMLKGASEGGVTGSETNLTIYGQLITSIQARLSPYNRRILKNWYAVDVDDLEWNVDFFQSKKTRLENEILEQQLEQEKISTKRMRTGEDMKQAQRVFGKGQETPDDAGLEEKQAEVEPKNE